MKMHLSNILTAFVATKSETELAKKYFSDKTITYSEVEKYLDSLRNK
jgi:hydroxymethylglutaryl-CoA reductase